MKKTQKLFLYMGLASMMAFASCAKEEDDKTDDPTATVENVKLTVTTNPEGIVSYPTGDAVIFNYVATGNADNNLTAFAGVMKMTVNGVTTTENMSVALTGTSYTSADTLEFDTYDATYEITFTLTGAKGTPATAGPFTYKTNGIKKSTPQLGNQAHALAKFWSGKLDNTFFLADVKGDAAKQADMDFAYCTRTSGNKLISPSSDDATAIYADQWAAADEKITTWTVRNTTGFIKVNSKINSSTFLNDALDTDSLIDIAKTVGEPSNPTVDVMDGDIYLYRTVRGTAAHNVYFHGLVYVSTPTGSVVGGVAQAGNVQLIVRYQKEN